VRCVATTYWCYQAHQYRPIQVQPRPSAYRGADSAPPCRAPITTALAWVQAGNGVRNVRVEEQRRSGTNKRLRSGQLCPPADGRWGHLGLTTASVRAPWRASVFSRQTSSDHLIARQEEDPGRFPVPVFPADSAAHFLSAPASPQGGAENLAFGLRIHNPARKPPRGRG